MSVDAPGEENEVGYGKPPASTRFRKGQSGNPRGRPRGRRNDPPYEAVLGQRVTIREAGVERDVTAAEAFLLHIVKQGLAGDSAAARQAMVALDDARAAGLVLDKEDKRKEIIDIVFVAPITVNYALEPLRMAKKLVRNRKTARMAIEPWIIEATLERLGDRRLSVAEQRTVVRAARTPWKVQWPEWWEVEP